MKELTNELFNKYKSDDKFIHNVVFAHDCMDSEGNLDYIKAMTKYTIAEEDFKVNKVFIEKAKKVYNCRKKEILKSITKNKLVFVGMGMDFKPKNDKYIGNHRIRTYFKNNGGVLCFVEFGTTTNKDFLRCDHGLMNTKKSYDERDSLTEREQTEKRIKIENIKGDYIKYTKENILKLVNESFNCSFKDVEVYSYFINTEDYSCISEVSKC